MVQSDFGQNTANTVFELVPTIGQELGRIDSVLDDDFPHIAQKIISMWGSQELVDLLQEMVNWHPTPDRKQRKGFPFYAMRELAIIIIYHNQLFPEYDKPFDIWAHDPSRGPENP